MTISLPYGIEIERDGNSASISSDLVTEFIDDDDPLDPRPQAAADAIESFLLAMAAEGVNVTDPSIVAALNTAVDSIAQNAFEGDWRLGIQKQGFIHGYWEHIFSGKNETGCRLVYDIAEEKIAVLELKHATGWVPASRVEIDDVEDSLKNANDEALEKPEDFGLERSATPPDWAVYQINVMAARRPKKGF